MAASLTSQPRRAKQGRCVLEIGRYFAFLVQTRLFARIEDGIFVVPVVVVTQGCTGGFGGFFFCQLGFERALFLEWCNWGGCGLVLGFFVRGFFPVALWGVLGVTMGTGDGLQRVWIRPRPRPPICS